MIWNSDTQAWEEVTITSKDRRNLIRNSNFYKATFDSWEAVNNPTLTIQSFQSKKWARIKVTKIQDDVCGIKQLINNANAKSEYTFQMLSEAYIQTNVSKNRALIAIYSIEENNTKTLVKEEVYDIASEATVYSLTFSTLENTKTLEVIISGNKNNLCDFIVTNIKLENAATATEWELAIEDIQDALDNKLSNTHEDVFNSLTDNGQMQGIYTDTDDTGAKNFYFNASYIKTGKLLGEYIEGRHLQVTNDQGLTTLEVTDSGNINIQAQSLKISGMNAATNKDITEALSKVKSGGGANIATNTNKGTIGWDWIMQSGNVTISSVIENGIKCCQMMRHDIPSNGLSYIRYQYIGREKYMPDKQYTVSFSIKSSVITTFSCCLVEFNGGNALTTTTERATVSEIDKWIKLSFTFTTKKNLPTSKDQVLYLTGMDSSENVTYIFRDLMIEEGGMASVWRPAYEDTESALANKVDDNQEAIFNKLFANGEQGFALENGKVYINGEVIKTGTLDASKITTGVLQAKTGGSYLSLDNGAMLLGDKKANSYFE